MAYRHVVLGFVLICFAVSFFPLMAYRHVIRLIYFFAPRIYFNSCTPPADRLLFLHIKCFLLSQVSCCSCTPGAPPIAELQGIAKQRMSKVQNKMAICHSRATTDRKANNIQCADQNGVPPLPTNKRPRSKQHPMRKPKWRYAPAGQQQTAKQTTSNVQTKMAIRPCRVTTVRKSNNIQCAE